MIDALNAGIALLILGLAIWTIVARDTFAAIVGYVAYGLLLTLAWVALRGVDVALTEAAIGGGLTGVLLIRAAAKLRRTEAASNAERPGLPTRLAAAIVAGGVAGALAIVVLAPPGPAPTLVPEVAANIAATGVGNPITAVLLAFRAIDTLLEAIVLLFALIGVWSLAPDRVWGGRPGPRYRADPDGILAYLARLLPPIGIIVGVYIFWIGADLPGGKFQGATILAAMWLLAMMAGLADAPPVSRTWLRARAGGRPGRFHRGRRRRRVDRRRVPRVSGRPREAADQGHRVGAAALARADARPDHGRRAGAAGRPMNAVALFGLCAAALVGVGVYGFIVNPQPLRKILAFNVVGSGVFLLFGAIARRGGALGWGGDPVPQALLITGIVVAFSATALAVTLLLRLADEADSVTLASDAPAPAGPDAARDA